MKGTTAAILKQIESLGYVTSVHRMRDYVEMHALRPSNTDELYLARDGDGDDEVACYRCACALAEAVGLDLGDS